MKQTYKMTQNGNNTMAFYLSETMYEVADEYSHDLRSYPRSFLMNLFLRMTFVFLVIISFSHSLYADELSDATEEYNRAVVDLKKLNEIIENKDNKYDQTEINDATLQKGTLVNALEYLKEEIRRLGGKVPGDASSDKGSVSEPAESTSKAPQAINECFTLPDTYKFNRQDAKIAELLRSLDSSLLHETRYWREAIQKLHELTKKEQSTWSQDEALKYQEDLQNAMTDVLNKQNELVEAAAGSMSSEEKGWQAEIDREKTAFNQVLEKMKPIEAQIRKQHQNREDYNNAINDLMQQMADSGKTDFMYLGFLRMGIRSVDDYLQRKEEELAGISVDAVKSKTKIKDLEAKIKDSKMARGKANLETLTGKDFELLTGTIIPDEKLECLLGTDDWNKYQEQLKLRREATTRKTPASENKPTQTSSVKVNCDAINCDCDHVGGGIMKGPMIVECKLQQDSLISACKENNKITGSCPAGRASGPNAYPKGQ